MKDRNWLPAYHLDCNAEMALVIGLQEMIG